MTTGPFSKVRELGDAAQLLSTYSNTQLTRKGGRWLAHCCNPSHQDNRPSMMARDGDNSFICFSRGCYDERGVSAVDYIAYSTGRDPLEVAIEIADRVPKFDIPLEKRLPTPPTEPPNPELNAAAFTYLHCQLPQCSCRHHQRLGFLAKSKRERYRLRLALKYMRARGISPKFAAELPLAIGSADNAALIAYLKSEGFDESTEGWDKLFFEPNEKKGWGQAFRFRGYLIFGEPGGIDNIKWWACRAFNNNARLPHNHQSGKPKGLLLGMHALSDTPNKVIITEGTIDYALARQWGYQAICLNGASNAVFDNKEGKSLQAQEKARHILTAVKNANLVIVATDADESGRLALKSLKEILRDRLREIRFPKGVKDIGDIGKIPNGRQLFAKLVSKA